MQRRFATPGLTCHPITLAVWLGALLTILVARTMSPPKPIVIGFHLPVFMLFSVVIAYCIPERVRAVALLICGPLTVLAFVIYPFGA